MTKIAQTTILFALAITFFLMVGLMIARAEPSRADMLAQAEKQCKEIVANNRRDASYDTCNNQFAFLKDDDDDLPPPPKPVAWRPWQQVWQCNDIRLTVTSARQGIIHYDL